jgi:hypothetical protein
VATSVTTGTTKKDGPLIGAIFSSGAGARTVVPFALRKITRQPKEAAGLWSSTRLHPPQIDKVAPKFLTRFMAEF